MLVLARKIDETIKIGEHITVTVLQVKGRMVKIGISAPRDVRVMRGELTPFQAAASPSHGEAEVLEATLDLSQIATADGLVAESLEGLELEVEEVEAGVDAVKAAHGLAGFRKQRERRPLQTTRAAGPSLMAATAN